MSFNISSALTPRLQFNLAWSLTAVALLAAQARAADFGSAEPATRVRTWRAGNGLPSDSVTALLQTRDGFLWIGTSAGLARFDGLTFTRIELPPEAPRRPLYVTALCEDSEGHLFVGTQGEGLFKQEQGSFRRLTRLFGVLDDIITSLAADRRGGVWVGTPAGLSWLAENNFKSYTTRENLPSGAVSGVTVARSGAVWITTRSGVCRLLDGRITPFVFELEGQGRNPEHLGVCEDTQGNLWAYGDAYLFNLAEKLIDGKPHNYFRTSEAASIRIWSACADPVGGLWVGTSGRGLFRLEETRFQPAPFGGRYDVRAICVDREGSVWLGTYGDGLGQLCSPSVRITDAGQNQLPSLPTCLALDPGGRVCVGLQRGGLFVGQFGRFERLANEEANQPLGYVSSLCTSSDGTIWAGTLGDGIYGLRSGRSVHFTTADGLGDNAILSMCLSQTNAVWVGTGAGTLHRVNAQGLDRLEDTLVSSGGRATAVLSTGRGQRWLGTHDGRVIRDESGSLTEVFRDSGHHAVLVLYSTKAGWLLCGTAGAGLTCINGKSAHTWTSMSGLPNDFVAGLVEDDTGILWMVTAAGICRVRRSELEKAFENPKLPIICELVAKTKAEPDSGMMVGGTRALRAPNGRLWFATFDGLMQVDTHPGLPEIESSVLPVLLESVVFNGSPPVPLLGRLAVPGVFKAPSSVSSAEFRFTTLSFVSPEAFELRHRLDGFDRDWVEDAGLRQARYGHLPYGRYRFRAAARHPGSAWQEAPYSFAFEVPTPFYLQTWAVIVYGLAAAALVAGTVRVVSHRRLEASLARSRQREALERERLRIARDMHDEIGSKLTKLSFQSERAKVEAESLSGPLPASIQSIAKTSQDLLRTLDEIVWAVNPHNDTLDNLVAYLGQYVDEYFQDAPMNCRMRLPYEVPHSPVSSEVRHNLLLTFEEALNNVLKHSAATSVIVEITCDGQVLQVKVADNGKGFEMAAVPAEAGPARTGRGGNGLANMRQRLQDIGGQCNVSSRLGQGTTVIITLRFPKYSANHP